jgi:parallel beta-helix repeat protein
MRREKKFSSGLDCPRRVNPIRRRTLQQSLWLIMFCLITSVVHAETYYVSPAGADSNPGTTAAPFRTINQALGVIGTVPGAGADTVVEVAAGTYNEGLIYNLPSGTSWDHPFILRARSGDQVIIQAFDHANIDVADGHDYYALIDGFLFDAANTLRGQVLISSGVNPEPRFLRFQNNEFINNRGGGFLIGGDNIEVVNNSIHGGVEEYTACGQVHCFGYAFYVGGSNNLFAENEIYEMASWVFHIYNSSPDTTRPHDNIVRNNVIHDFGYGDPRANGILLSTGPHNSAYGNVIYNGSSGISALYGCTGCEIVNNKISDMDRCLEVGDSHGVVVDGNILSNCAYADIFDAPAVALSNNTCDSASENCP